MKILIMIFWIQFKQNIIIFIFKQMSSEETSSSTTIDRPITPTPTAKPKRQRKSKYATPEEAHQAKLRQMREWRLRKKAEAEAAKNKAITQNPSSGSSEEAIDINGGYIVNLRFSTKEQRDKFIEACHEGMN